MAWKMVPKCICPKILWTTKTNNYSVFGDARPYVPFLSSALFTHLEWEYNDCAKLFGGKSAKHWCNPPPSLSSSQVSCLVSRPYHCIKPQGSNTWHTSQKRSSDSNPMQYKSSAKRMNYSSSPMYAKSMQICSGLHRGGQFFIWFYTPISKCFSTRLKEDCSV